MFFLPFFRRPERKVYLVQIYALPAVPEYEHCGGAYVNCWISFNAVELVNDLAQFHVEKNGWRVKEFRTPPRPVNADDPELDPFSRQCRAEAVEKGYSLSFYPWRTGENPPQDADAMIRERNRARLKKEMPAHQELRPSERQQPPEIRRRLSHSLIESE